MTHVESVHRDIAAKAEDRVQMQERESFRLASSLADAQAELAESRNRMAEMSEGHTAELAARANVAALQQTALASERATSAKLAAEVQDLKGTLAISEVRTREAPPSQCRVQRCISIQERPEPVSTEALLHVFLCICSHHFYAALRR